MSPADQKEMERALDAARSARERAYAPYSGYRVGAALLYGDGTVVAGCNVENRLLGLSICAERVAVTRGVARGLSHPVGLVVVTASSPPAAPCGLCRETLAEFVGDLAILLVGEDGERRETSLSELLPLRFELPPADAPPARG